MTKDSNDKPTLAQTQRAERHRVAEMIRNDQIYAAKQDARRRSQLEVRDGEYVNIADSVDEPTPEWLAMGDVMPFTPKQPDGTVRTITSVRRVITPIVKRMHDQGKLSDDQYSACCWYRDRFELAGLEGRWGSSQFSLTSGTGGTGVGASPMAMHEHEAVARQDYRAARDALTSFYVRFFEAVVLHDIPISRSWRFAKSPKHKAETRFRVVAQEMAAFCAARDIKFQTDNA